jgi:hypothetical protein
VLLLLDLETTLTTLDLDRQLECFQVGLRALFLVKCAVESQLHFRCQLVADVLREDFCGALLAWAPATTPWSAELALEDQLVGADLRILGVDRLALGIDPGGLSA